MESAANKALIEVMENIKADAKAMCPVGTPASTGIPGYIGGSLKASIRREVHTYPSPNVIISGVRAGGYIVNPNSGKIVDYARWVEEGTYKMRARPFLGPAFIRHKAELAAVMKRELKP